MFLEAVRFERARILRFFPTVFFSLAFPVMLLFLFGSIYGNDPTDLFDGLGTVDVSVPSYMALVIAVTGLMSFPLTLAEYRDRGVLRRLQVTPASPLPLLMAQLVVNAVLTIVGVALLVLVGAIFFDLTMVVNWGAFVPVFALSLLAIFSIGFLVAAWAPNERAATMFANLFYFPMIFLSGATIPLELFPEPLQAAAKVLPLTWAVKLLRATWIESVDLNWTGVWVLAGTFLLCSTLAIRFFRWD